MSAAYTHGKNLGKANINLLRFLIVFCMCVATIWTITSTAAQTPPPSAEDVGGEGGSCESETPKAEVIALFDKWFEKKWVSESHRSSPATAVQGYSEYPGLDGLSRMYILTGDQRYIDRAVDVAMYFINTGQDVDNYGNRDGYLGWRYDDGTQYPNRPDITNVWDKDHYEWRSAMGISFVAQALFKSPAGDTSNALPKIREYLEKHYWEKWSCNNPNRPTGASVGDGYYRSCIQGSTSTHMTGRNGVAAIALHMITGDQKYQDYLDTKGTQLVDTILANNFVIPILMMPTNRPNEPDDFSHAQDVGVFLVNAYENGYTFGGKLNDDFMAKLTNQFKNVIYAGDQPAFHTDGSPMGTYSFSSSEYYVQAQVAGWGALAQFDQELNDKLLERVKTHPTATNGNGSYLGFPQRLQLLAYLAGPLCPLSLPPPFLEEEDAEVCALCNDPAIDEEFEALKEFTVDVWWGENILVAIQKMSDQLSALAMQQTMMIGSFFDAKHQLESQRIIQNIDRRAHKDYHISEEMCTFGSAAKSLAASERKSELMAHVLSQRQKDRNLGNASTVAAAGAEDDFLNRVQQYGEIFCDPSDNNGGLYILCNRTTSSGFDSNKDIDYQRTIEYPLTINTDTESSGALRIDRPEIFALAANLYGDIVFERVVPAELLSKPGRQSAYLDSRAYLAKLSVAENTYNAIVGMKSRGTDGSREFIEQVLVELGADPANGPPSDVRRILGREVDDNNNPIEPSYYAQMEILTKKIYQNPDFYTNLYDKPANIDRKKVAMQAIGLMQKFDLFNSHLRYEALTSQLLENALVDDMGRMQIEIENSLASQKQN